MNTQYFTRYAEAEIRYLAGFPDHHYDQVLCIPVYDETPDFLRDAETAAKACVGRVLLILVINQPEHIGHCQNNEILARHLQQQPLLWSSANAISLIRHGMLDILWLDRFSAGKRIDGKQGVGLARKIACDIAALLVCKKQIATHQIFCSDADVIFPEDYFLARLPEKNSAGVLGFRHTASQDQDINAATQLYEKSLHHYVNGLQQAGSQYAFHTIGSCLLLNAYDYIKARGFPVRAAGEDFYLLNKLQKLAPVASLAQTVIGIKSRLSTRVPFGTGPAVAKLLAGDKHRIFYHPACFKVLQAWLEYLDTLARLGHYNSPQHANATMQEYLIELDKLFSVSTIVTRLFGNHKTTEARICHLHQWFDAFKTLKAIHHLRDRHFASISYRESHLLSTSGDSFTPPANGK